MNERTVVTQNRSFFLSHIEYIGSGQYGVSYQGPASKVTPMAHESGLHAHGQRKLLNSSHLMCPRQQEDREG